MFRKEMGARSYVDVYTGKSRQRAEEKRDESAGKERVAKYNTKGTYAIGMTRKTVKEGRCRDPRGI